MKYITAWLYKHASVRNIILAIMVIIPFNALIFPLMSGRFRELANGMQTLDVQLGYLPGEAIAQISQYGEAARKFYILIELTADLFYPVVYATLFSLVIALVLKAGKGQSLPYHQLALLPVLMMAADYVENFSIVLMLTFFPTLSTPAVAWVASVASFLKWLWGGFSILALLIGSGILVTKLIRGNQGE
jgi:hypothetical protein